MAEITAEELDRMLTSLPDDQLIALRKALRDELQRRGIVPARRRPGAGGGGGGRPGGGGRRGARRALRGGEDRDE